MMRTHSSRIHPTDTMKRLACTSLAMAALFGLAQMQVFAQTGLEKVGTIDLSPYFGPDKAAGTHPVAIDYDGQRIFLAGYNAGETQHAVRMVILDNLDGEIEATLSTIPLIGPPNSGSTDVVYIPETDSVYLAWYDGSLFSIIGRFDPETGEPIGAFGHDQSSGLLTYPGTLPFVITSLARDPGFAAGTPGAAFPALSVTGIDSTERHLLDPITGDLLEPDSLKLNVAPVEEGVVRDHIYDPGTGDIWARAGNAVVLTPRTGDSTADPAAVAPGAFQDLVTLEEDAFRRIALIPASAGLDTQPWLLFNDRPGGESGAELPVVKILRADGSTTGLPLTALDGSEGGDPAWGEGSGPLAPAVYTNPTTHTLKLAVLAAADLRIDLYGTGTHQGESQPVRITSIQPAAGGGIRIVWDNTLPGPYRLEGADSAAGPFATVADNLETNEYVINAPEALFQFYRAFTVGGGTEPGEPPVIVAIQITAEGVEIVWEPAGQGVYAIERAPAPTGPFEPIASGVTSDRHLDTAPPEGQAFYRVIRTDGGTPVDIDPIRVQITGITVSPDGNPVLHWTAEGDSAYRITRSADFNGPYTTLTDEAQGGTWEDAAPEDQHAFYQIWLLP